jgi:hypothetical protein
VGVAAWLGKRRAYVSGCVIERLHCVWKRKLNELLAGERPMTRAPTDPECCGYHGWL